MPSISRIIPNYSSADVAKIIFRVVALRRSSPVFENIQIALLGWMTDMCPGLLAWTLRWFRVPVRDGEANGKKVGDSLSTSQSQSSSALF